MKIKSLIVVFSLIFAGNCLFSSSDIVNYISANSIELNDSRDLDKLIEKAAGARLVLLGESSHGTSEYYKWRYKISRRLIEEKGFDFIAVEGDWPSWKALNDHASSDSDISFESVYEAMSSFNRWPQWMWANEETAQMINWAKAYNAKQDKPVGFYGFDVYSFPESLEAVIEYTSNIDDEIAEKIIKAYTPLMQFKDDPQQYARLTLTGTNHAAEAEKVVNILLESSAAKEKNPAFLNALQNAYVVKHAERHYRAMTQQGAASWNRRVEHMKQTVNRLMEKYGPDSKGILWAHNTHIGDARATEMQNQGMKNLGWLTRDKLGRENVFAVGFSTHRGQVLAGRAWGAPVQTMTIPNGIDKSIEDIFNQTDKDDFLLIFCDDVPPSLMKPLGHRAIGVIYHPEREFGNYVPTILPERYDAFIFFTETSPLTQIK